MANSAFIDLRLAVKEGIKQAKTLTGFHADESASLTGCALKIERFTETLRKVVERERADDIYEIRCLTDKIRNLEDEIASLKRDKSEQTPREACVLRTASQSVLRIPAPLGRTPANLVSRQESRAKRVHHKEDSDRRDRVRKETKGESDDENERKKRRCERKGASSSSTGDKK